MPTQSDWTTIKRLGRYLKGTADLKLKLPTSSNPELIGYMTQTEPKIEQTTNLQAGLCSSVVVGKSAGQQETSYYSTVLHQGKVYVS